MEPRIADPQAVLAAVSAGSDRLDLNEMRTRNHRLYRAYDAWLAEAEHAEPRSREGRGGTEDQPESAVPIQHLLFQEGKSGGRSQALPIPGIVTYVEGVSGKFFNNKAVAIQSSKASYDESAAKRLWEIRAELTHLDTPAL